MPRFRKKKDRQGVSPSDKGLTMKVLGPSEAEAGTVSDETRGSPVAGTSTERPERHHTNKTSLQITTSRKKRCWMRIYNPDKREFLGRTGKSWLYIVTYSIMYMLFLCTYTMLILYISLVIVKNTEEFETEKVFLFTYSEKGVGLTATPTAVNNIGNLIWYQKENEKQIEPYVKALDDLLHSSKVRRKRQANAAELGPCGSPPYGYGDNPCVILRINRLLGWSAKPLTPKSLMAKTAPEEVQRWMVSKQMLWFHCSGHSHSDREHIGEIKYYPDPPGIDPSFYPQNESSPLPFVAAQFKRFTLGISLVIQCKLWHADGTASVDFVLYVAPSQKFYLRGNRTSISENT